MPGKLCSKWIGPFVITDIFSYGTVEIKSEDTGKIFKVNGHRLKPYHEGLTLEHSEEVQLCEPRYSYEG